MTHASDAACVDVDIADDDVDVTSSMDRETAQSTLDSVQKRLTRLSSMISTSSVCTRSLQTCRNIVVYKFY